MKKNVHSGWLGICLFYLKYLLGNRVFRRYIDVVNLTETYLSQYDYMISSLLSKIFVTEDDICVLVIYPWHVLIDVPLNG
jgi:hypothetical protein